MLSLVTKLLQFQERECRQKERRSELWLVSERGGRAGYIETSENSIGGQAGPRDAKKVGIHTQRQVEGSERKFLKKRSNPR